MLTIQEITETYKNKIDFLDLEILIANSLKKTREFVLTYPNQAITKTQETKIHKNISRRINGEPIAYILGQKEFYGLNFVVNKHTLVPRPETEMIIDEALHLLRNMLHSKVTMIDVGTGSGCITISIAHAIQHGAWSTKQKNTTTFLASDISKEALTIAKKNAAANGVNKKIKFLHGDLLKPFLKAKKLPASTRGNDRSSTRGGMPNKLIITANLPYLSKEIYNSAPIDVKKFEPKSALYSPEAGLQHYRKLLEQIKQLHIPRSTFHVTCFLEFSPEQKKPLTKLIKNIFPKAKIEFKKDLAEKWRTCKISVDTSPSLQTKK